MLQTRWFQVLRSLGLEFWLPLPLLGLVFWIGGGFVMDRMLSRSYGSAKYLQADTQLARQPIKTVLSIKAEIKRRHGVSRVKVKTANSALKELEFEFPVTELSQVEAAISEELGLSRDRVKELVHYQTEDRD